MGTDAVCTGSLNERTLVVLDFDWTVVDGNTDTEVRKLVPNGELPAHLGQWSSGCWTDYMQSLFVCLHERGVGREEYVQCMRAMVFTAGMDELIRKAGSDTRFEVIIVSDSNTVFIDAILQGHGLDGHVRKVFTNPGHFDEQGCLRIAYYHTNTECQLSELNMCKGRIVREYVQERRDQGVTFDRLAVVGDGKIDYCPVSTVLGPGDWAFAREGFTLEKMIGRGDKLPCRVHIWRTGHEICQCLGLA